jgi:hypothetical protein
LERQASARDFSLRQSHVDHAGGVLLLAYLGLQLLNIHSGGSSDASFHLIGLHLCTPMGIE